VQFVAKVFAMTFTVDSSTSEAHSTEQVVLADFDGDSDLDYIAFNDNASEDYILYSNNGSGTFSASTITKTADNFLRAAVGDVDGDGDLDFVTADDDGDDLYRYLNNGSGTFSETTIVTSLTANATDIILADVDQDGDLDMIYVSSASAISNGVYLNNGHAVFTAASSTLPTSATVGAADVDSDGDLDLLLQSSGNFSVYKNSGTGAFVQLSTFTSDNSTAHIAFGDIDGDGDIDAIVTRSGGFAEPFFNNGAGSFTEGTNFGAMPSFDSPIADLDNDGYFDSIFSGNDSGASRGHNIIFLNNGSGVYSQTGTATDETICAQYIAIGDIDVDGDLDYITANTNCPTGGGAVNRHYKSDQAATSENTVPTAPGTATMTGVLTTVRTPRGASTVALDSSIGTINWINGGTITIEDGFDVSASLTGSQETTYLKTTGFGFNIPTNATILGIKVEVKKYGAGSVQVRDNAVRIVKGGTIGTTDRSSVSDWPSSTFEYVTHGGSTDLWGETWTPSDINASNFGFAISAKRVGGSTGLGPSMDYLRITVYYEKADVRLSWGSGSDTQTATRLLQYQLKVGTGSSTNNIMSGKTNSPNYVTRVMPNGQSRTMLLKDLACGFTYYWSVATVDSGFKTAWSSEQQFTLSSSCAISFPASSSSSSSSANVGGGLPWSVFRQNQGGSTRTSGGGGLSLLPLTVSLLNDVTGDGKQTSREQPLFLGGLPSLQWVPQSMAPSSVPLFS
jgi:hypothetical protein